MLGVNSGAQRELSGEDALGSLANEQLIALPKLEVPLRPHRQSVSLNCHVDRAGIGARQVEVDDELVTTAIGVHRAAAGASSSGDDLLGQLVKLSKGIKIERHLCLSRSGVVGCRLRGGYSASAVLRRDVARDDGQTEGVLVLSWETAASSSPRALLNALADRARAHGVHYFTALVEAENQQSIQMVRDLGDADRSQRRDVVSEATEGPRRPQAGLRIFR